METLQCTKHAVAGVDVRAPRVEIFVDCVEEARQDLLVLWLGRGDYLVHKGPPPEPMAAGSEFNSLSVLLTDRFGPGFGGGPTIGQRKATWPGLRVVVIGSGDDSERAQLSLARATGADVTLPGRLDRDALFQLLGTWR